ncbi:cation diffusion facilitator family transporter [Mariniplasma anaerobium]|uniref:Cation diffusion facilitator transporter n=1 Tax=Mariniplasma anaerobium TaxID=2735436 RepID=A0A7U9TJ79_9MOLU|nr:cation diffusion facilitator family transporter [Mariniplasma anaerobium]BCR35498.1 cation diffusion facilitator transporter [Mariniplasma anaerobium]
MTKQSRKKILSAIYIGLIANIFLTLIKIGFGLWGNAQSLVSDGINSFSDIFMSLMIFFVLKVATKKPDHNHPYGHQKFEGLAYFTIGIIFSFTAIFIGYRAVASIIEYSINQSAVLKPDIITLYISILSLGVKIGLTIFYFKLNKLYKNPTIKAEYKNHFFDIWSTSLTVIVLVLAQYNLIIFDYIGSLIISFFILRLSISILKEAATFLVDQAPDNSELKHIRDYISSVDGVVTIDDLKARMHMTELYVDVEIGVKENLSLKEAHEIAEYVHEHVEHKFEEVIHCMVHVNPHK